MPRKNVSMHPAMTEATREQLDRLARQQGVSRSEIIRRAVNLLDVRVNGQLTEEAIRRCS